ncbi:CobW family GTP-binding protein [Paenalcaligenes sp. Me131]|uniref:CobW family GTP-binding protein n=1 Tax=Paenalcaligenes sp. Me131 TaxID=3392636 RepID=UPI003D29B7E4
MMQAIPLVVIGGFLGAGKTTLLNHLLTHSDGLRIGVLVNDFGPLNVDAALVAGHDGETLSLTNGCVCCSVGSGFEDALIRVLDCTPAMDLIVIEASGVSDPGRIAQVGLSEPMLQLAAVITLVDAEHIVTQLDDLLLGDTLERQISAASVVLINKIDLISTAALESVQERLRQQFGDMAMMQTQQAQLPMSRLLRDDLGVTQAVDVIRQASIGHALHHEPDHPFEGGVWSSQGVLEADELIRALRNLPKAVIRVKGWVATDRHGTALVHLAGGRVRIVRATSRSENAMNTLVYIGMRNADITTTIHSALAPLLKMRVEEGH